LYQPTLDLATISRLTGNEHGVRDTPCPLCSHLRKAANRRKRVLRIWNAPGFATWNCAHCGAHGHTRDKSAVRPDWAALRRTQTEAEERKRVTDRERIGKARWLWSMGQPVKGTRAETYLGMVRGYSGPIPGTLRFLEPRGKHGPALIGAFGSSAEPMLPTGSIPLDAIRAVHLTRLRNDGLGKASDEAKIMIGRPRGEPLVLAPINDGLGLAITEGIEDALSVHSATGLGVWAAGSASQLPALAEVVPWYAEAVTIFVDDDDDGRRYSAELAHRLRLRGIEVGMVTAEQRRAAA
jgi:hypothetical protein